MTGGSKSAREIEQSVSRDTGIQALETAANIIYVSTNGSDVTGDGTTDLPFRTIKKGIVVIYQILIINFPELPS